MGMFPQLNWRKAVVAIGVSGACVAGIAQFEGFSGDAYPDPAQPKNGSLVTIGYGHTGGVKLGDKITRQEAEKLLVKDAEKHWNAIKPYIKVPLYQHEADAYTSFTFNVGVGNFKKSNLLKKLNQSRYSEACAELKKWVYAGGRKLTGLVKRREAEYRMCMGK